MLVFAIVLFLIAACFGVVILKNILQNHRKPRTVVLMHGTFAFFGLLIAITYMISQEYISPILVTGIVLLILAAMGGFSLLMFDLSKKPIPKVLALIHPLVALSGVVTLIIYLLSQQG